MQCPLQNHPGPPPERIHIPWMAAGLFNCKTLLTQLSEDPAKVREELEQLVTMYNLICY